MCLAKNYFHWIKIYVQGKAKTTCSLQTITFQFYPSSHSQFLASNLFSTFFPRPWVPKLPITTPLIQNKLISVWDDLCEQDCEWIVMSLWTGLRILAINISDLMLIHHHGPVLILLLVKPLTPAPPVTGRDEPWHLFPFWRHGFRPKLTSSILNFCRRKKSFQWCPGARFSKAPESFRACKALKLSGAFEKRAPDQSDKPNGALDMQQNAQKVEWETPEQNFLPLHLPTPC